MTPEQDKEDRFWQKELIERVGFVNEYDENNDAVRHPPTDPNPVALGKGSPLFVGLSKTTKLQLIKTREFKSGNILQYYIPAK